MIIKRWSLPVLLALLALVLSGCVLIQPNTEEIYAAATAIPIKPTQDQGQPLELEFDEEAEPDFDIPRTLTPATEADQVEGVQVDYVIRDDLFATQLDEITYYADEYLGKSFSMVGYVLYYDEPNPDTQFAVIRDYIMPEHDHDEDELIDHDDGISYPVGFDCYYEGDLPAEDAWVRVVGTLADYNYVDPDDGEVFPALMLMVQFIETIPDTEGGSRTVEQ